MNGLMTIPDQFQYGETPQDPLQMMQGIMMQGQGPLPPVSASPYKASQTPVDIFNSILGRGGPQELPADTSNYGPAQDGFDPVALQKAIAELEEEEKRAAMQQQANQFVSSQVGKGMEYAQGPQVQATSLPSLMAMVGGR